MIQEERSLLWEVTVALCEKSLYEHLSNFQWFVTERELFEYINTKAILVVVKDDNLLSVTLILI